MRVIGAYFPNGQAVGSEKYVYKLGWIASLQEWIAQLRQDGGQRIGLVGTGDVRRRPVDRFGSILILSCGTRLFQSEYLE